MPLVDLKTNLKSLRYGNDQQGGGSSNQPYIKTPIPDQLPNQGYDTYLRNGSLYGQSATDDFNRIKLFLDSPLGENWITKQKDLSRQSTWRFPLSLPVSQIYDKQQTLDQIKLKDNTFSPEGGPWIHIYKQGGLSLPSLGYLNPLNYGNAYKLADQAGINRLTNLYRTKISTSQNLIGQAAQIANSVLLGVTPDIAPGSDLFLQTYYGGTDTYGGQVSVIPRTTFSTNKLRSFDGSLFNNNQNIITFDQNFLGNLTIGSTSTGVTQGANLFLPSLLKPETFIYGANSVVTYTDFRKTLKDAPVGIGAVVPKNKKDKLAATDYRAFNREKTYKTGNPGIKDADRSNPYQDILTNVKDQTSDLISLQPLYKSNSVNNEVEQSDLIKFTISVVDNDDPSQRTWIHFRAFLNSFGDAFSAGWNNYKYVGRAESFYRYSSFDRSIKLSFTAAVQSRQEQFPLYQKLNYLASLTAPDYSESGFMRGNLVYLTVGDWLVDVPGVLKGMSLGIPDNSPWEIAKSANGTIQNDIAQLPFIVEVSGFDFAPIHNFVPKKNAPFIGAPVPNSQKNYFAPSPPFEFGGTGTEINPNPIPSNLT
jgi:hypothetical protein